MLRSNRYGHDERDLAVEETERIGEHADDFARTAVEHQGAADRRAGRAPNFDRQYPAVKITVSGVAGVASALENTRPSIGWAPSIGSTPSVTNSAGTSSGSADAGDADRAGVPEPDVLEHPAFFAVGEVQEGRGAGVRGG